MHSVTYSPQDDKLRVYFVGLQSEDVLAPIKAAGFRWAGMQECWFAVWTPAREDAALAATGADGIDDEPTTMEERAEARAERFEGYSANAASEAAERWKRDRQLSEQLNGQPILIGHHSEKGHRAMLARAWRNFFKAGEANKRADYWASRASAPMAWASYKEKPGVRARRIKALEADLRSRERDRTKFTTTREHFVHGAPMTKLVAMANYGSSTGVSYGTWSALEKVVLLDPETQAATLRKIIDDVQASAAAQIEHAQRWIDHLTGRLAYEREQIKAQGCESLLAPKPRNNARAKLPILNIRDGAEPMTSAEYAAKHKDYKGTRIVDKAYRVRTAMIRSDKGGLCLSTIFLVDKPEHQRPASHVGAQ